MPSLDPTLLFLLGTSTGLLASSLGTLFFLSRRYKIELSLAGQQLAEHPESQFTFGYPYTAPVGARLEAAVQVLRREDSSKPHNQQQPLHLFDRTLSDAENALGKPYSHIPIAVPQAPAAIRPFPDRAATPRALSTERPTFGSLKTLLDGVPMQTAE